MDLSAMLENSLNSKITALLYSKLYGKNRTSSTAMPDSTRRAFLGQMEAGSRVALQGAQNMEDAASLVTAAQSDVTAIKDKLNEMKKIAIEASSKDILEPAQFEVMQNSLRTLAGDIAKIAKHSSFNGINLLDGSAGMDNDGVISLQAGNSARDQVMTNMLDTDVAAGQILDGEKINLNNLKGQMNLTNKADADILVQTLTGVFDRVQGVESQYSYDVKSLHNMSVLLMGQADIMGGVVKNHAPKEEEAKSSPLEDMLNSGMGGNIMNAMG